MQSYKKRKVSEDVVGLRNYFNGEGTRDRSFPDMRLQRCTRSQRAANDLCTMGIRHAARYASGGKSYASSASKLI